MKLQELKTEVYFMSDCKDTKCLKSKYPQFSDHNFRLVETWQQVYDVLVAQEAKQVDEEQPVTEVDSPDIIDLTEEENLVGEIEIVQESYTEKGQIDLPKREEEITPHLVLNFVPAAQRISKQGKKREGTFISRRIRKDKSKGFGK